MKPDLVMKVLKEAYTNAQIWHEYVCDSKEIGRTDWRTCKDCAPMSENLKEAYPETIYPFSN
jgi:hypothetical protein